MWVLARRQQHFHVLGHCHICILLFLACTPPWVAHTSLLHHVPSGPAVFVRAPPRWTAALIINNWRQYDDCGCRLSEISWALLRRWGGPLTCIALQVEVFFSDLSKHFVFVDQLLDTKEPKWNVTFRFCITQLLQRIKNKQVQQISSGS